MTVPNAIRRSMRDRLWREADELGWLTLSSPAKARHYEVWTKDNEVGGILSRYMDRGQIRVYIKDTLIKDYSRERLGEDAERIFRIVGLKPSLPSVESYIKPHGRRLADGKVVCWGRAEEWKTVLLATFERCYHRAGVTAYAAVLLFPSGRFDEEESRTMIAHAASQLGIEHLRWLET